MKQKEEDPITVGIRIRIKALDELIIEQEHYLAMLRMKRIRLTRDIVASKRANYQP